MKAEIKAKKLIIEIEMYISKFITHIKTKQQVCKDLAIKNVEMMLSVITTKDKRKYWENVREELKKL